MSQDLTCPDNLGLDTQCCPHNEDSQMITNKNKTWNVKFSHWHLSQTFTTLSRHINITKKIIVSMYSTQQFFIKASLLKAKLIVAYCKKGYTDLQWQLITHTDYHSLLATPY